VIAMHDDGEPISRGQVDRPAAEARALRDSVVGAALFGVLFLLSGILAALLIAILQSIGWWEAQAAGAEAGATALAEQLGRWGVVRALPSGHAA